MNFEFCILRRTASKKDEHIEAYGTWKWEDCKAFFAGNRKNVQKAPTQAVYQENIPIVGQWMNIQASSSIAQRCQVRPTVCHRGPPPEIVG